MLIDAVIYLAAAVLLVPLFRAAGLGAVLGYLAAGVIIGPHALALVSDGETVLHFGELGVVLLLFVIGLELRPQRLWALRRAIFGFGSAQLLITAVALALAAWLAGLALATAAIIGAVLALSSTAFALQLLAERGEMNAAHGRKSLATLLFQDIAVVPLLALIPLFGTATDAAGEAPPWWLGLGVLVVLLVAGRFGLRLLLGVAARAGVREVLTATALLLVLGTALVVQAAGLSMALGAFIAGVLLADSEYRHQLEADIEPFKGLLLGLFFIAVGMTLDLPLLVASPAPIIGGVVALVAIKFAVLYGLGRFNGLDHAASTRLGLTLSQGGEFAFVLFGVAVAAAAIEAQIASALLLVVSISMISTPLLLTIISPFLERAESASSGEESMPDDEPPVLIAGFGRFGQMTARILRARHIPFTALDASQEQIAFVGRYGNEAYFGDATRLDLLHAAGAAEARILVMAIDDEAASVALAKLVSEHFPQLKVYARARNRHHAYELMDAGVHYLQRETFLSALDVAEQVLLGLGDSPEQAARAVKRFEQHDVARLWAHRESHTDEEKMQDLAKEAALELAEMFEQDLEDDTAEPTIEAR